MLTKILEKQLSPHFEIEIAYDGQEAIQFLKKGRKFAAIVLDLVMPKVSGFEVARFLRSEDKWTRVIVVTARPIAAVEKDLAEYDIDAILAKPIDYTLLIETLRRSISKTTSDSQGTILENRATGKKYPIKLVKKICFICGYDPVNVFIPIANGLIEDWSKGPFPIFHPQNEYDEFDLMKTWVSVCPYCFFASADPMDFAPKKESAYPYSEESKKILARSISFRKKLLSESLDIDPRFDLPYRDRDTVISSLILAEKCSNGLILAGKIGAYCQTGVYTTFLGALNHPSGEKYYKEAMMSFENQLKHKEAPRSVLVQTYYFCIVLNMLLSKTILGRDIMKKVETIYQDAHLEDLSEAEREWLMRINYIWKNGIDLRGPRQII